MTAKKAKKELDKEALSRVKVEMAEPRMVEMAEPRMANSARGQLETPIRSARRVLRFCWQWR